MKKTAVFVIVLALILTLAPGMALADGAVTVDIFSTNDIHGVVDASNASIGLERVASIAAAGSNSILVDAGDATQGASFATISEGRDVITMMNAAGYDVMVPGNHEFDFGVERLLSNAEAASFPIISANVTLDGEPLFEGHTTVKREGMKIAFIGVTTADTISNANPTGLEGVEFENEITAVKRELSKLQGEADAVVLVCHMGNSEAAVETTSKELLDGLSDEELALVTAVVDGHSHTLEDGTPYERGGSSIPVVQAGTMLSAMGHLTLTFSDGTVTASGEVIDAAEATAYSFEGLDESKQLALSQLTDTMTETLAEIRKSQSALLDEKLIYNETPVWGGNVYWDYSENRIVETAYGDLVTDAFAQVAGEFADVRGLDLPVVAVENGGGIAVPMYRGDVTYGDILDAFNHANMVVAKSVTPAQLYEALEVGLTVTGQDETGLLLRDRVSGSFLQVSGFTYTYDPAGESGSKVTAVVLDDGTRLDRSDNATTILLATNSYVASSVAGIADGEQLGELGGEDSVIRDYLLELTENGAKPLVYPVTQNRILYANDLSPEEYAVSIPVVDLHGAPVTGMTVHAGVDSGTAKEYITDDGGKLNITVPKGAHAVFLDECDIPVYVNNYSGSGTVTTRTGYCEFSFTVVPPMAFTDVDSNDWFWDTVSWAWENGVMSGKSATIFDPNGFTTRAEAVMAIWNLDGAKYVNFIMPFSDVEDGAWYTEAVRWAASEGIVVGRGGLFEPGDRITREELATLIFRYEAYKNDTPAGRAELDFPDADEASAWAVDALSWCVYQNIIDRSDITLVPGNTPTRAEFAQMLRMYAEA